MSSINFNGSTLYNAAVDSTLASTNPDVWCVAGETGCRASAAAITTSANTGGVLTGSRLGKNVWTIYDTNSSIDVATTINNTTKDWTVAIGVGNLSFHSSATVPLLFCQNTSGETGTNANHKCYITLATPSFTVDEVTPSGGSASITYTGLIPTDSVITFAHTSTSSGELNVYVNGALIGNVAHTETYDGGTATKIRIGNISNASQIDSRGLQVYGFAAWESALSAANIQAVTLDKLTSPLS